MALTDRKITTVKALCEAAGTPFHELCYDQVHTGILLKHLEGAHLKDVDTAYVYCGLLRDVHIFGRSFIHAKGGSFVFRCQSYLNYNEFGFEDAAQAYIDQRADLFSNYYEDECIFFGGMSTEPTPEGLSHRLPNGANFGHFIFEYLTRLATFDVCGLLHRLPIIVYDTVPERWLEFLELMGIPKSHIIRVPIDTSPAYRKVWVSSACNYRDSHGLFRMWGSGLHWTRFRVLAGIGGPRVQARRRIYIGRQDAKWRRLANESEIEAYLRTQGFESLQPSKMSARDQVEAMAGAEVIVVVAGAGTIITQFASEHCAIIALRPNGVGGFWGGMGAALFLRQIYERIDGPIVENPGFQRLNSLGQNELADFTIDLNMLKDKVGKAIDYTTKSQFRDAGQL